MLRVTGFILFDWFEKNSGQFQHIILPPRSSDMNPLEYIQDMVKIDIRTQVPAPTTTA